MEPKMLLDEEKVELAFKCGRDSFLLTSHRILKLDVQGISGTRVEYLSILWKCLRAFSVESAGSWDLDCDMKIYTNIGSLASFEQDFRKGKEEEGAKNQRPPKETYGKQKGKEELPA